MHLGCEKKNMFKLVCKNIFERIINSLTFTFWRQHKGYQLEVRKYPGRCY